MKRDIIVPISIGLHLAIVPTEDSIWDLFLINKKEHSLQNILVVSNANCGEKKSSTLRYFLESITPISYIKFETVYGDVAAMDNVISITYYVGMDIYEKEFKFNLTELNVIANIDILGMEGYLLL